MQLSKKELNNLLFYYGELSYIYYNTTGYLIKRQYANAMNEINYLLGLPLVSSQYIDYKKILKEIKDEDTNI